MTSRFSISLLCIAVILSLFIMSSFIITVGISSKYLALAFKPTPKVNVDIIGPLTVGNRQLEWLIKAQTGQNSYMQFRLFNAANNQTIQHVTYLITVTRGASTSKFQKPLLLDFFHAHNGLLTLHVEPNPGLITIYGEQDPFLNAWVADPGGDILIRGPLLLQGGLYHFHVEIFTVDNDRSLFIPQQAPKFNSTIFVSH